MTLLEERTGRQFGSATNPLLVSVRSGAPVSMPGMMDTILNLGLNDETVEGLAAQTGNPKFAYDAYRRFVKMFGDVVLGIHYALFNRAETDFKKGKSDADLTVEDMKGLIEVYKRVIRKERLDIPDDPNAQLRLAIDAVFNSFNTRHARHFRKSQGISDDTGTAVNVQAMVFGNMGGDSATGVCFTRNPKTGEKTFFGEWLPNAQGEDVVAGTHTLLPLNSHSTEDADANTLEKALPEVYKHLVELQSQLEQHYKDMQDIEFTIEQGKLYLLQTRTGKRSPSASIQIAVDLVHEGLISKEAALQKVEATSLELIFVPSSIPMHPKRSLQKD